MLKKVLLGATLCLAIGATTASAQTPRISISGLFGYTFADGVSGDGIPALDGNIYNRIDPQDSVHFGFSAGVFVNPQTEIGFLWRRQMTKLDISGTSTRTLGDQNIDNPPPLRGCCWRGSSGRVFRVNSGIGLPA